MKSLPVLRWLGLALALPISGADAQVTEEQFRRALLAAPQLRDARFAAFGLAPAAQVAAQGRSVRRFQLAMWIPNDIPTVEVGRLASGRTIMRLLDFRRASETRAAPARLWQRLAALDAMTFAPVRYDAERLSRPGTSLGCHGDIIRLQSIEAGTVRSAGGGQCVDSPEPFGDVMNAALAVYADALLTTEPACRDMRHARSAEGLLNCYSVRSTG